MPEVKRFRVVTYTVETILIVVAIISLVMSFQATNEQKKTSERAKRTADNLSSYVKCQAEWTNFLYKSTATARQGNQNTQKALDDLVNAVASAKSADDSRAALARYKQARAEQLAALEKNPLPPPPEQVCELRG